MGSSFGQPEDSGRDRVGEPKSKEKPFVISKWVVWEAYQRIKANRGAPGVDGCSIEDFEEKWLSVGIVLKRGGAVR